LLPARARRDARRSDARVARRIVTRRCGDDKIDIALAAPSKSLEQIRARTRTTGGAESAARRPEVVHMRLRPLILVALIVMAWACGGSSSSVSGAARAWTFPQPSCGSVATSI